MKKESFYAIYTTKQTVLTFTQNYKKFKKDFLNIIKKSSFDLCKKRELKQYFALQNYSTVNRILDGKYVIAEYPQDVVINNVLNN
ncbi:hypothetical protein [Treponema bryantii]|uniref:hypothetical protein n=1 Tax=Treponema bryantii TaxID=163 RepID=UPI002B30B968|nr:hypothetical protein TRBR_29640 [Treponema bryantii]